MTVPDTLDEAPQPLESSLPALPRRSRALSLLEVLLCSGLPTQILIGGLLIVAGARPASDGVLPFSFVVDVSLLDTCAIVALATFFLRLGGESPRAVLLGRGPINVEVRHGVAWLPFVFILVISLGALVQFAAPWLHNVPQNPLQAMLTSPWRVAIFALVVVLAGGVREEVQRAFILHRFERDLGGAAVGLAIFSVAFGLGHLTQGFDAALITGALGLLWGLMYLARRSMVAPAVSHALFNLVEIALYQYASKHGLLPPTT
ncbi:MAG: CPBP family intramembrane metalloprotease [Acidobacteria bacterium]|nr:CPBP family intramembrane metalloprotease [Acidobacteriota bacterium]